MKKFDEKCDEILVEKAVSLEDIKDRAMKIELETIEIKKDAREFLIKNPEYQDIIIDEVDSKFIKKLKNFPGDITAHRIAKVFSKLEAKI